jgi:hypothetical protein
MKERPILFSGPMVRAILDGSKTQTRRVVKPQPTAGFDPYGSPMYATPAGPRIIRCPYGIPGDRLWGRETWAVQHEYDAFPPSAIPASARWHYAATEDLGGLRKRPSIFLPKRGTRILLEITDVRVQRLHEISQEDARKEGADKSLTYEEAMERAAGWPRLPSHRSGFKNLWKSINGADSWNANPWVWAITFRRLQP